VLQRGERGKGSGYRGELMVGMINLGKEQYTFRKGEKIAQLLIQKIEHPTIKEVEELSETHRGEKRFGSSGK
jgi:dUTP pyrophosphatase